MQKYFFSPHTPILSPRRLELARPGGPHARLQPPSNPSHVGLGVLAGVWGAALGTPHLRHTCILANSILGAGEAVGCPWHPGKRGGSREGFREVPPTVLNRGLPAVSLALTSRAQSRQHPAPSLGVAQAAPPPLSLSPGWRGPPGAGAPPEMCVSGARPVPALHPGSLHPAPCNLHPASLHPAPCTQPSPCTHSCSAPVPEHPAPPVHPPNTLCTLLLSLHQLLHPAWRPSRRCGVLQPLVLLGDNRGVTRSIAWDPPPPGIADPTAEPGREGGWRSGGAAHPRVQVPGGLGAPQGAGGRLGGQLPAPPSPVSLAAPSEEAALLFFIQRWLKIPLLILIQQRRVLFWAGSRKRNPTRVPAPLVPPLRAAPRAQPGGCAGGRGGYLKPSSRAPSFTF